MFIDHEAKCLFTGDNVNPHLWMHRPGAVTLEEWMDSTKLILSYMEQGYTAHTGHGNGTQSKTNVETICCYVQEIIDKQRSGQLTKNDSPYPEKDGDIEIQFNIHRVTKVYLDEVRSMQIQTKGSSAIVNAFTDFADLPPIYPFYPGGKANWEKRAIVS